MIKSSTLCWWNLELVINGDLEEIFLWKFLNAGINNVAFQSLPCNRETMVLMAWIPLNYWTEREKNSFINSLCECSKDFGLDLPRPKWKKVENEDWSISWKKHWHPDPIGIRLLILPAWLEIPDEYSDRIVVRLDPGVAFGTGSHPTTRLCLEAFERNPPKNVSVIDLGCGSGILGLTALSFGAKKVFAVDIDSFAVNSTEENAHLNNFNNQSILVGNGSIDTLRILLKGRKADLLVCNILANVIEDLAPEFESLLAPDGQFFLSGLLLEQVPKLIDLLESLGWNDFKIYEQDRWALIEIHGRKEKQVLS